MKIGQKLANTAINFVFPPICAFCEDKLDDTTTPFCTTCWDALTLADNPVTEAFDETAFSAIRGLYLFDDRFQQFVHHLKYDHKKSIGLRLGLKLWEQTPRIFFNNIDIFIPVPIHHTRFRERGYNQAELIAHALSDASGIPMETKALVRTRRTGTQTALTRGERNQNLGKAFKVKKSLQGKKIMIVDDVFTPDRSETRATKARPLEGLRILLIDDVFTTGATVNECSKVLIEAGAAEVRVLTAARVV